MLELIDLEKKYGLKIVKSFLARNKEDAILIAENLGYPVAIKIDSPDILHKSDIGCVELNLTKATEVEKAYGRIMQSAFINYPESKINGVIVQEMFIGGGFEIIIGFTNDIVFGPSIMLGMGGIFAEVFKDISFRALPLSKSDAKSMIKDLQFSSLLTKGFRHIQKVSTETLSEVLLKVAKLAEDNIEVIDSFDINPAVFQGNDYRIVDFKHVPLKKGKVFQNLVQNKDPNIKDLDIFFRAQSVALIGVTEIPGRIGNIIMDNLINSGFGGKVFPVNPKYERIMGIKTYPTILEIKEKIDLVVVTISLYEVPKILCQCNQKNISNVIIISAGGKEIGNTSIEEKIKEAAKNFKIRVIGCNCLGVFDGYSRIDTLFQPYANMKRPVPGSISMMSQSGTVGIASLELLYQYGVSKFVSYGNRIDVDEGDLISFFAKDERTKVIAIYIEGLENGRKFFRAAKEATANKPIVVYKAGRTPEASRAAISHTGFLSGTHNIIKGIMEQANIIQVDSLESLLASSKVLSIYSRIKGNRVLIITNGAGVTIQAIDRIVIKNKLILAKFSKNSKDHLKANLPNHVIVGNPVDLTGTATDEQYEEVIKMAINDKNIDLIMAWFVFQCKPITENIAKVLKKYIDKKPVVCGAMGEEHTHYIGSLFQKEKIPIFYSVEEWVSAAEALPYEN